MAAIARRGWSAIKTEILRRLGGTLATGFDGRVEFWIWAGYLDLATQLEHFELQVLDTALTLSTANNTRALPADCHVVISMQIKNPATDAFAGTVGEYDYRALVSEYRATVGVPTRRARFKSTLYFDLKPDLAYKVDLSYYKLPAAPDFSTTDLPATAVDCDEVLLDYALVHAYRNTGRPDLAGACEGRIEKWVQLQPRPLLVQDPLVERRESMQTNTTLNGAQG